MLPFTIIVTLVVTALVGVAVFRSSRAASSRKEVVDAGKIEAEVLLELALRGGGNRENALELVRRYVGADCGARGRIDLTSWLEQYVRLVPADRKEWLLDAAVRVAMEKGTTIGLPQYDALVEIAFGLGFHSDALARLRRKHGFDYVDWAKHGRPREADRGGGATPLFDHTRRHDRVANLLSLGLEPGASRQEVSAAYRRLASECHPDRFHDAPEETRSEAAERFRAITQAYEELLVE